VHVTSGIEGEIKTPMSVPAPVQSAKGSVPIRRGENTVVSLVPIFPQRFLTSSLQLGRAKLRPSPTEGIWPRCTILEVLRVN
jgi:hypothetical protein